MKVLFSVVMIRWVVDNAAPLALFILCYKNHIKGYNHFEMIYLAQYAVCKSAALSTAAEVFNSRNMKNISRLKSIALQNNTTNFWFYTNVIFAKTNGNTYREVVWQITIKVSIITTKVYKKKKKKKNNDKIKTTSATKKNCIWKDQQKKTTNWGVSYSNCWWKRYVAYLFGRRCHSSLHNNDCTVDVFFLHTCAVS